MNDGKIGIKILCEGLEEYKYIKRLISFPNIFSDIYYFHEPVNCKGIGHIFPRYQDLYNKNLFDVILIFCDGDNNSKDFQELCSKIDNLMFEGNNVSSKIIIYANPVTLQIVLSHIADVLLISSSKGKNEQIVYELTGITNYRAHENQIDEMMKLVKLSNYSKMKERISKLSSNVNDIPSTNFLEFLNYFENSDINWVEEINNLLF